ncbi:MAG: SagB/ThcOx family dehydrogenase [Selenomonadaceae bacterium]|nr:SagB/ThcOx family dehydrogenase [Selenomonadaceae bacterium]
MKKFLATLAMLTVLSTTSYAAPSEIILPTVQISDGLSVMQALQNRKSDRNFVEKDLTPAQLAKILWAADGINRDDSKRVNPAALGVYSVEVYAVTREGIYLYDADKHRLKLIAEGDFRALTTTGQSFVEKAAVNLIYVETPEVWTTARRTPPRDAQISFANIAVGAMVQSVALAAQTEGLGNCVRGSINRDAFKQAAKLSDEKNILLAQSVGFIK